MALITAASGPRRVSLLAGAIRSGQFMARWATDQVQDMLQHCRCTVAVYMIGEAQ
jgi:hypothetical protein